MKPGGGIEQQHGSDDKDGERKRPAQLVFLDNDTGQPKNE